MAFTVPLPFLTEADPDRVGEGSIDPLGLSTLADRLADQIAPDVTARMSRIRFLTAIAAGANVTQDLADEIAIDGRSPAYLAFEWIVVEALARRRPSAQTLRVPGIQKTRRMLDRSLSAHMDSASYLQVPKVFGFHGVYKRLARALGLVDQSLQLLTGGDELLRIWERESHLPGFADRTPSSSGGKLAARLQREVQAALAEGKVTTGKSSWMWTQIADSLAPDDGGRRERMLLWDRLIERGTPIRRELLLALRDLRTDSDTGEADALRAVAPNASEELGARIDAIEAFELVAHLLTGVLQAMRVRSTSVGARAIRPTELAGDEAVKRASKDLPDATRRAAELLLPLGEETLFEEGLGHFVERNTPVAIVEEVLAHHEAVQDAKGKRPWIERANDGFYVRAAYRTTDESPTDDIYIHPYRVEALSYFIRDLDDER